MLCKGFLGDKFTPAIRASRSLKNPHTHDLENKLYATAKHRILNLKSENTYITDKLLSASPFCEGINTDYHEWLIFAEQYPSYHRYTDRYTDACTQTHTH